MHNQVKNRNIILLFKQLVQQYFHNSSFLENQGQKKIKKVKYNKGTINHRNLYKIHFRLEILKFPQ